MPTMDQVTWASLNIVTGGKTESFTRGALLPDPADGEEAANRSLLRLGGAIRTVEVVYTAEELAEHAQAHAEAGAARAVQHDVDPSLPSGDQLPGTAKAGPPVLESPGGSPVVIGPEPPKAAAKPDAKDDAPSKPASTSGASAGAAKSTGKN